jgi:septum formation protein
MLELVLVSQSPRRQHLLSEAGFKFRVDTVKLSEIIEKNVNLRDAIEGLARQKAQTYVESHKHLKSKDILVLTADTVVFLGDEILGKPKDQKEAVQFLGRLSDNTHSVITGLCLWNLATGEVFTASDTTKVYFRKISPVEIEAYVATGEPMDKAGAYAIQGLGRNFVSRFEGAYDNVVGLPVALFESVLKQKGWNVARRQD